MTMTIERPDAAEIANRIRLGHNVTEAEFLAWREQNDDAGELYSSLLSKVGHRQLLKDIPGVLKTIIRTESWRQWRWLGQEYSAPSLAVYLTRNPPQGIGVSLDMVEKLVEDDAEILALWREATTGRHGGNRTAKNDNIILASPKQGTSLAYTLDRLKRERPDLFERVAAKKISANAAAIEAGFRKPPSPLAELRRAWRKASTAERDTFRAEIAGAG